MKEISFALVIERTKITLNIKTDADLSARIGITAPSFSQRRQRESIPFGEILTILPENVSLDWLFYGRGEMLTEPHKVPKATALNTEMLTAVIGTLEHFLTETNKQLLPQNKSELIMTLYEMMLEEEVSERGLAKVIELAI